MAAACDAAFAAAAKVGARCRRLAGIRPNFSVRRCAVAGMAACAQPTLDLESQHLSLFGAFQGSTGTPFCDLLCGMNNNIPARLSLWLPPIDLSDAEIRACSRMKKT